MIKFVVMPKAIDMYKQVMLPGWTFDGTRIFRYYGEALAHLMGEQLSYYSYFPEPTDNQGRKEGDALERQSALKSIGV